MGRGQGQGHNKPSPFAAFFMPLNQVRQAWTRQAGQGRQARHALQRTVCFENLVWALSSQCRRKEMDENMFSFSSLRESMSVSMSSQSFCSSLFSPLLCACDVFFRQLAWQARAARAAALYRSTNAFVRARQQRSRFCGNARLPTYACSVPDPSTIRLSIPRRACLQPCYYHLHMPCPMHTACMPFPSSSCTACLPSCCSLCLYAFPATF